LRHTQWQGGHCAESAVYWRPGATTPDFLMENMDLTREEIIKLTSLSSCAG